MIWLMLFSRIASDKVLHDIAFILLKIENMMDNNTDLFQWFINILVKSLIVMQKQELILMQLMISKNKQNNYTK